MLKYITKTLGLLNPFRLLKWLFYTFVNWRRQRFQEWDYVVITLPQTMPPLPTERNWIQARIQGEPPFSLWELRELLEKIADDPRPQGVIFKIHDFAMPQADLTTLRNLLLELQQKGKKVISFASGYDTSTYYVASVADQIFLQPGGMLDTTGLRQEIIYMHNGLEAIGVKFDVVAITPFKGAADPLIRQEPSPENLQQTNWLLDSMYEIIVEGIATGRDISVEAVHKLFDESPCIDLHALEAGFIDGIINEEDLAKQLEVEHLITEEKAEKVLLKKPNKTSGKSIAILNLSGNIMDGESKKPPVDSPIPVPFVGDERIGDETVVQQVRNLMNDEDIGAVVLHIDSPGGSASASEAMTSALVELAKSRPLVVYMNSVAASGGYYLSTPAQWIVAQPNTITGSIGVIILKPVIDELIQKLRFNPVEFLRGENAGYDSPTKSFTEKQRGKMQDMMERGYDIFLQRVSAARKMPIETLMEISGGRVWTGKQALENGLVDELGGFQKALSKARELANLPMNAPLEFIEEPDSSLTAQLAEQANPVATWQYWQEGITILSNKTLMILPFSIKK